MKKLLLLSSFLLVLAACVDTTGISPQSTKQPRGNPNAAVTLMEFSDFECPACRAAHVLILKPLLQKYGDRVAFVFKQFPLLTIHHLLDGGGSLFLFAQLTFHGFPRAQPPGLAPYAQTIGSPLSGCAA